MAHAILSPSGEHRWGACPGAPAMEMDKPNTSSKYADEGTAAHFLASECLTSGVNSLAHKGAHICIDENGAFWFRHADTHRAITFEVDADMVRHVQMYLDIVRDYAKSGPLLVEQSLPIDHITGEADAEGTGDAVVLPDGEIIVIDLKYGQGLEVSAEDNGQLKMYALGALKKYEMLGDYKRARLVIVQPRINSQPSEWDISIDDLIAWGEETSKRAKIALIALEYRSNWMGRELQYLVPGEKQCHFCKAKATCPALAAKVAETVGAQFEDITPEHIKEEVTAMANDDAGLLGAMMKSVDLIEDWCTAIRAEVERRLLAGSPVGGYKLVQGKRGNRAWTDAEAAEQMLKGMRLKTELKLEEDPIYTYKLVSPTVIEKLLKEASPKRWARLQPLIGQSEGKPSVAVESDKRPALVRGADQFADVIDAEAFV